MSKKEELQAKPFAQQYLNTIFKSVKWVGDEKLSFNDKDFCVSNDNFKTKKTIEMKVSSILINRKNKNGENKKRVGYFCIDDKDFKNNIDYFLFVINLIPFENEFSSYVFYLISHSFLIRILNNLMNNKKERKFGKRKQLSIIQLLDLSEKNECFLSEII